MLTALYLVFIDQGVAGGGDTFHVVVILEICTDYHFILDLCASCQQNSSDLS